MCIYKHSLLYEADDLKKWPNAGQLLSAHLALSSTVDAAQVSSLGSEGEDEAGLWGPELHDSVDKTSLTPSEGTEEPSSPSRSSHPHSLSPSSRTYWAAGEAEAADAAASASVAPVADGDGGQEAVRMFCESCREMNTGVNCVLRFCTLVKVYIQ